jgi:hypothetical protein
MTSVRVVRASAFRHVYAEPPKVEDTYQVQQREGRSTAAHACVPWFERLVDRW